MLICMIVISGNGIVKSPGGPLKNWNKLAGNNNDPIRMLHSEIKSDEQILRYRS